jgi:hypothetical protein
MFDHSRVRQRRSQQPDDDILPLHNAPPMSQGRVKGLKIRRKRRACKSLTKTCLAGASAALVSGTLSLLFMPSITWLQVDYHHQVQKAASRIFQKVIRHKHRRDIYSGEHDSSNSGGGGGGLSNNLRPAPYESMYCPNGVHGWINDNYCDCLDGSDEPQTSACSYRLVHHKTFICHDDPSHLIYASRVGDGVWDCKDGSDEKQQK